MASNTSQFRNKSPVKSRKTSRYFYGQMDLYQFYQINFYMYILKYLQHRKTVSQFWVEKTGWLWHVLKKKRFFKRRYNAKKGN